VGLAARGQRESDRGLEKIGDTWLLGQLQRQAREVLIEGALGALLLTGLVLMLPG
jgi:hypothetical protein